MMSKHCELPADLLIKFHLHQVCALFDHPIARRNILVRIECEVGEHEFVSSQFLQILRYEDPLILVPSN